MSDRTGIGSAIGSDVSKGAMESTCAGADSVAKGGFSSGSAKGGLSSLITGGISSVLVGSEASAVCGAGDGSVMRPSSDRIRKSSAETRLERMMRGTPNTRAISTIKQI